jgi:hypothetical protein
METVDEIINKLSSPRLETRLMLDEIRFLCQYDGVTTWRASGTIMRYQEYGHGEMVKIFGDGDGILGAIQALERRFNITVGQRWGE